jgi:hypothetical protein
LHPKLLYATLRLSQLSGFLVWGLGLSRVAHRADKGFSGFGFAGFAQYVRKSAKAAEGGRDG